MVVLTACADDDPQSRASDPTARSRPAPHDSQDAAGVLDRDGSLPEGRTPPMDAGAASCSAMPIPEGELQNRASGSSVFGRVVGGEAGRFDIFGDTECGIADVRVCLFATDVCTESDEAGQFVLSDLPEGVDAEISFEKPNFRSALRLVQLQATPVNLRQTRILRRESSQSLLATIGEALDDSTGSLVAVPVAAGEGIGTIIVPEGVSVALMPGDHTPVYSLGAPEAGGPSLDALDRDLSETRFGGWAFFPALEAGDYVVHFERDGATCGQALPGSSHGVDDSGSLKVKVVAGFSTASVVAFCP